jgi:hypothetical protein
MLVSARQGFDKMPRFGMRDPLLGSAWMRRFMDHSLTEKEIRLLKELKGAGDHGRVLPNPPFELQRLMRAGYVKRQVIDASADRYVITEHGVLALDNAMA